MKNTKSRIRKSVRQFYILFLMAVIVICSVFAYKEVSEKNKIVEQEVLNYRNQLNTNYTVNIKENPYISEKTLPMGNVYITDLIDSIDMNLNYSYVVDEDADIKYEYRIVGILNSYYLNDGTKQKVLEKEYELKPWVKSTVKGKDVKISELVNIKLDSFNEEIEKFSQEFEMALESDLLIKMQISTISDVKDVKANHYYSTNIQINLGEKTTQIQGNLRDVKEGTIRQEYTKTKDKDAVGIVIYIVIIVISALCLIYLLLNTRSVNVLRNSYKAKLNRILKSCDEKIVKLSKKIDVEGKEIIEVKDFGELIKLSEELYKPVLYWEIAEKEIAEFFVITNNIIYRYKLEEK